MLSMPQFAEQGFFTPERHWAEIENIMRALSHSGCNVLISLHPRVKIEEYLYLEDKFDCRIARERLADLIPAANVFVAQFSSTVVWAALCGVPTVVINLYDWQTSFYDYLQSVRVITSHQELVPSINKALTHPSDFSHDWNVLSRDTVFDGRTTERYWNILASTLSSESGQHAC